MPLVRRLGSCTPAWPPAVRLWFGGRLLAEQDEVTVSARPSGRLLTCVVSTRRRARDGPHPASSFRSILDNSGSRSPAPASTCSCWSRSSATRGASSSKPFSMSEVTIGARDRRGLRSHASRLYRNPFDATAPRPANPRHDAPAPSRPAIRAPRLYRDPFDATAPRPAKPRHGARPAPPRRPASSCRSIWTTAGRDRRHGVHLFLLVAVLSYSRRRFVKSLSQ